jgi:hypothetical protein
MAFIDNSGDIILDAVLTDTGRFRLAKGDGSFKIVKFALGDDEINYSLYNKDHASGSAYYDLEILQTPVFEAFTNNTSTMNSKLLSIPRTNLLYLPILKINNASNRTAENGTHSQNNGFAVAVTQKTYNNFKVGTGVFDGEDASATNVARLDQGLDTRDISFTYQIDQSLKEEQYIVEMDSRLGYVVNPTGDATKTAASFIDDDNIASYYVSTATGNGYVSDIKQLLGAASIFSADGQTVDGILTFSAIAGPQGSCLRFRIKSTLELISSDFLFDKLGGSLTNAQKTAWLGTGASTGPTYKYIDTIVKVTGATTGFKIDVPVRFIKCTAACDS